MSDQKVFETVYRGRQSALHHVAYMRMCKVLLALHLLRRHGESLEAKSIFDYGFGAGTFFRYCPKNARISGVEMDACSVAEVEAMLKRRSFRYVELQVIKVDSWESHPLLKRTYDVFLCSHVLEHLQDPVAFLQSVSHCISANGIFLGLVPINEIAENPHHVQKIVDGTIVKWAEAAGYDLELYVETDEIFYPFQPLFTRDTGIIHKLAQVVSLILGIPATFIGEGAWWKVSRLLRYIGCKPTQAGFILKLKTTHP